MPCRKKDYKDLNKFRNTLRNQHSRYRIRTGAFLYESRIWDEYEDKLVLEHNLTDRELSVKLCRSVGAIQKRRWYLRRSITDEIQPV